MVDYKLDGFNENYCALDPSGSYTNISSVLAPINESCQVNQGTTILPIENSTANAEIAEINYNIFKVAVCELLGVTAGLASAYFAKQCAVLDGSLYLLFPPVGFLAGYVSSKSHCNCLFQVDGWDYDVCARVLGNYHNQFDLHNVG